MAKKSFIAGSYPTSGSKQAGGIYRDINARVSGYMKQASAEYTKDAAETRGMGYPEKPFAPESSNLKKIQGKFGPGAGMD